ncbi:MAG: hypothetical protein LC632_00970 [Xanthomonadaceae bacterium]|nr:hypothetical protein [Xanthomonadaceae bacterium]
MSDLRPIVDWMQATHDKEAAERIVASQWRYLASYFEKSVAYANVLVIAGYASYFGLWTLARTHIDTGPATASALLMAISVVLYLSFQVFSLFRMSQSVIDHQAALKTRLRGKSPQEMVKELEEIEDEAAESTLKLMPWWRRFVLSAIVAGLAAFGILGYEFVRVLHYIGA